MAQCLYNIKQVKKTAKSNRMKTQNTTPETLFTSVQETRTIYKRSHELSNKYGSLTSSKEVANLLRNFYDADEFDMREFFYILILDRANKIIAVQKIGEGGISGCVADVRLILKACIDLLGSSLIISHNHPSGRNTPSDPDKHITTKIKQASELLDIKLLDHIILTKEDYFSFSDNGLI